MPTARDVLVDVIAMLSPLGPCGRSLATAALLLACIDLPQFGLVEGTGANSVSPDASMIRVPSAVLDGDLLSTTGNGNGNGPGKKDAGTPPPAPSPGPPPAPPPTSTAPPAESPAPTARTVPAFWLDIREVTTESYAACVVAGSCTDSSCPSATSHPVSCVTVEQARLYCTYKQKRLVTDDEFTAATAGTAGRSYPWGNDAPSAGRLSMGAAASFPVGSFVSGATPDGVLDLAGNVAEWVESGNARGGSFEDSDTARFRSTASKAGAAAGRTVGFRCARD